MKTKSSARARICVPIIVTMMLTCGPAWVAADVITVGPDPACDASSIGVALFAALASGDDEIRLANNQTYTNESVHLTDWAPGGVGALTIVGGYDTCTDTTPSGRTVVSGGASNPVFEIDSSSSSSEVTLRSLEIVGSGESGVLVEGNSDVTIENCYIRDNDDSGLRVEGGATVSVNFTTSIRLNQATLGGGIHCSDSTVTLEGLVRENTASSSGGGVFAETDCSLTVLPGGYVELNDAQWGGGIYATSSATVTLNGVSSTRMARVVDNTASNSGGGVYANGTGTWVIVNNARVTGNSAALAGGGLYATNSARITTDRVSVTCIDAQRCTRLSGNTLTTAGEGIAAYAENGATIELLQTWIEGNAGAGDLGFLLYATGAGTEMELEGVQLWDNGSVSLFESRDGASLVAAFATAAGNRDGSGGQPRLLQASNSATAQFYSSILRETSGSSLSSGAAVTAADCLILDAIGDLPGPTFSMAADPLFRDLGSGDLRPRGESPAVDYCDTTEYSPVHYDLEHKPRGYDSAGAADNLGPFDLGGFEIHELFSCGFEQGDTSCWSSTVP